MCSGEGRTELTPLVRHQSLRPALSSPQVFSRTAIAHDSLEGQGAGSQVLPDSLENCVYVAFWSSTISVHTQQALLKPPPCQTHNIWPSHILSHFICKSTSPSISVYEGSRSIIIKQ